MKAFAKSITQESSSFQQTMKALEIRRWMIHVYSDYGLSKQRFRHLQDAVTPAASNTGISTNLAASCAWYKKRLPQLLIITHPSSLLLPQPLSTPIYLHLQRPWSLTRTPPAEKQKKLILLLHRRTRKKRIRKTRERKTRKQNKQTKAQARAHTHTSSYPSVHLLTINDSPLDYFVNDALIYRVKRKPPDSWTSRLPCVLYVSSFLVTLATKLCASRQKAPSPTHGNTPTPTSPLLSVASCP